MKTWRTVVLAGFAWWAAAVALGADPRVRIERVEGRVLLREENSRRLNPVEAGHELAEGEALLTGDASRFEAKVGDGGGTWRVGRRAIFALKGEGVRLLAGTALVQVPDGGALRLESTRCVLVVPEGTWLVQAVDNRGFKVVCLDGGKAVEAWGEVGAPAAAALESVKLAPGELVFLQPDGRTFSPRVTVFLEELLATSRLVNGFPEEFPGMRRLGYLALAQSERLTRLSNAMVVGAKAAGSFQIAVPDPTTDAKAGEKK